MELQTIFPDPRTITLGGKSYVVREFKARELPQVLAIASKLTDFTQETLASLLDTETDRLLRLLAGVSNTTEQDVGDLPVSDLLTLLEEVVAENVDFFVQRLPEAIRRVTTKVTAGSTQSNS